jgi:hypothetical protein
MTVEIDATRKAKNLKWDKEAVGDNATIVTTNPETGDTSSHDGGDDGYGVVTFPFDYEGVFDVVVTGDNGEDSAEGLQA